MPKINITIKDGRPSICFKGTVSNEDIRASIKVLSVYLKHEPIRAVINDNPIDIPLGDYNGKKQS